MCSLGKIRSHQEDIVLLLYTYLLKTQADPYVLLCLTGVHVEAFEHLCVGAFVYPWVWRPEVDLIIFFLSFSHLTLWDKASHWTGSSVIELGWLELQRSTSFLFPTQDWSYRYGPSYLSVLCGMLGGGEGVWTQVLMLQWQAVDQLSISQPRCRWAIVVQRKMNAHTHTANNRNRNWVKALGPSHPGSIWREV